MGRFKFNYKRNILIIDIIMAFELNIVMLLMYIILYCIVKSGM